MIIFAGYVNCATCRHRINERHRERGYQRTSRARVLAATSIEEEPGLEPAEFAPPAPRTPLEILVSRDHTAIVHEVLAALPPRQAQVIGMAFLEGRTHREIAEAFGVTHQAVSLAIERGLERARRWIFTVPRRG